MSLKKQMSVKSRLMELENRIEELEKIADHNFAHIARVLDEMRSKNKKEGGLWLPGGNK